MKKIVLTIIFTLSFLYSHSCSCVESFKGYKGYPMTLGLAAKVFQNLTLIEIQSVDLKGAKAKILIDYCNKFQMDSVFIANMDPGWECGYSTDKFTRGDKLLTVFTFNDYNNHLSTCFESYVNVSEETTHGLIEPTKDAKARKWKISEIEELMKIEIKN